MSEKHYKEPSVYLIGATDINWDGLSNYLNDTNQDDFHDSLDESKASDGENLCSFFAKLCYSSLILGKNTNVSRVRDIEDNLRSIVSSGHGSVLEHITVNFVITNVSRVFTHELVRHRVGTAFSQTSGRYVRTDQLNIVMDPILKDHSSLIEKARGFLENWYKEMEEAIGINEMKDFSLKKKLTSALRRLLPNGQANEIGFSCNLRTLRHLIELRTSRHAEWEIRFVFNQIYTLVKDQYRILLEDATVEEVDGLNEVTFKYKKI